MRNSFALLCQPDSSRILRSDRVSAGPPEDLALASLRPLQLSHKQVSTLAHHRRLAAKLPRRESLIRGVLSTIGWLAGLTATLAGCSSKSIPDSASSDSPTPIPTVSSVSSKEIKNYAKAVLAIEPSRQAAYEEIQKMTNNEKLPDITCTKADTIAALGKSIQDIAVNYCNQAKKIGESQGLTISQFNAITVSAQSNPELRKRIQNELVRLQR